MEFERTYGHTFDEVVYVPLQGLGLRGQGGVDHGGVDHGAVAFRSEPLAARGWRKKPGPGAPTQWFFGWRDAAGATYALRFPGRGAATQGSGPAAPAEGARRGGSRDDEEAAPYELASRRMLVEEEIVFAGRRWPFDEDALRRVLGVL